MKRIIAVLILAAMLLTLAACESNTPATLLPVASAAAEKTIGYFMELTQIPRQSHHEEKISEFMYKWFTDRGYATQKDNVGNIIADIPATAGYESKPLLVLQGHMDMVCVADEGVSYNPLTDSIKVINDGVTLTADGTSLGADNGIGVAIIMYITDAENKVEHGPLRILLTVGEEVGMTGVKELKPETVTDAKHLINLDTGESNILTNGCTGSKQVDVTAIPQLTKASRDTALKLSVSGMLGGHSGANINKGRINATKAAAYILAELSSRNIEYEFASFVSGTARNSIPNSAEAVFVIDAADYKAVSDIVKAKEAEYRTGFAVSDGGFTATLESSDMPSSVFVKAQQNGIVTFAATVVNGVQSMSQKQNGLEDSSSNIGIARVTSDEVMFSIMPRSAEKVSLDNLVLSIETLARVCGLKSEIMTSSSPWPINEDSRLAPLVAEVYKEQTGKDMTVEATHSGLECGVFAAYNPKLDIVSIGPDASYGHTTKEVLYIDSVGRFIMLLNEVLLKID